MKINPAIRPVILAMLMLPLFINCKKVAIKTAPTVTISTATNITTTTATSGGEVTGDGGTSVTSRGVCWSVNQNPTIVDAKTSNSTGTGSFTSSLTGLTPGTTYYLKAYATNSIGTAYSSQTSLTTLALAPVLTTTAVSAITSSTATSGGNITNDGGSAVTARGVCWGTATNPTISGSKTSDATGSGSFTSNITGLTPGVTYYIRAYATNSIGTAYGNEVIASATAVLPVLTTTAASAITATTATSGGNITSNGGAAVTVSGVCWGTATNPTIALSTKTTDGLLAGTFTGSITGLTPGTTYYIRAYATNSIGTAYGNELSFNTLSSLPILTTTVVSSITATSATSGGNITSDGGSAVTISGVCWSTSANPTIALSTKTTNGSLTGTFTGSITGLAPGTTYYVRAYATNSIGIAYGNELSFNTLASLPILTTTAASNITATTATGGGNITSDGGAAVTARGVCWNTSTGPTIANYKTTDATGTGSFTSTISGLTLGTNYYIRAYATNSVGTVYGNELTLTTSSCAVVTNAGLTYGTVTDVDGNVYKTITVGTNTWMAENLRTRKYRNGDAISNVTDGTAWSTLSTGAWCDFNNATDNCTYFGKLYNYYALSDARQIAPTGWHIPTDTEWQTLNDSLTNNGYGYGGSGDDIAKALASTSGWTTSGTAGQIGNNQASNNSSGFTAAPAGFRGPTGSFSAVSEQYGYWWSSTVRTGYSEIWNRYMLFNRVNLNRANFSMNYGFSVRCVKD